MNDVKCQDHVHGTKGLRDAGKRFALADGAQCHQLLAGAKIPHAVMGGVAVCLHGYQRNTVDVDLLIRRDDWDAMRMALKGHKFAIRFHFASDPAGPSCEVKLPNPGDDGATTEIEGLPVLTLARLIESKLRAPWGTCAARIKISPMSSSWLSKTS